MRFLCNTHRLARFRNRKWYARWREDGLQCCNRRAAAKIHHSAGPIENDRAQFHKPNPAIVRSANPKESVMPEPPGAVMM